MRPDNIRRPRPELPAQVKLLDLFERHGGVWQKPGLVGIAIQRDPVHPPWRVKDDHIKLAKRFRRSDGRDDVEVVFDFLGIIFAPGSTERQLSFRDGMMQLRLFAFLFDEELRIGTFQLGNT